MWRRLRHIWTALAWWISQTDSEGTTTVFLSTWSKPVWLPFEIADRSQVSIKLTHDLRLYSLSERHYQTLLLAVACDFGIEEHRCRPLMSYFKSWIPKNFEVEPQPLRGWTWALLCRRNLCPHCDMYRRLLADGNLLCICSYRGLWLSLKWCKHCKFHQASISETNFCRFLSMSQTREARGAPIKLLAVPFCLHLSPPRGEGRN